MSLAQETPDHPEYDPTLTAGASKEAEPRFGKSYLGADKPIQKPGPIPAKGGV